jgi:acyl carrier protein
VASQGTSAGGVHEKMIGIVKNMTADWDTGFDGEIGSGTRLIGDLGFESIDVVHLVVAIETTFGRSDLPFEDLLMRDGRYVDELTIGDAVTFLEKHL